jgi:hypothetical protein
MTPQPLPQHELANRMAEIAWAFNGCTADDLLAIAGFLATSAWRCFEPEARIGVAEHWCSILLGRLRESLD